MTKTRIVQMISITLLAFLLGRGFISAQEGKQDQRVNDNDITVIYFEEMKYPGLAFVASRQGVVVVRVNLDGEGNVVSAEAISGDDLLVRDALSNARKWRFRPNSSKTASIIYEFRIPDGACGDTMNQLFVFRAPNMALVELCRKLSRSTIYYSNRSYSVIPSSLTFGELEVGTEDGNTTLGLNNDLKKDIRVGPVTITGRNAADFHMTTDCGPRLAPGEHCTVTLYFAPKAPGTRRATLNINNSYANGPQTVALTGTGTGN